MARQRNDARLAERESRIMQFIEEFGAAHGLPPTQREIADHLGLQSTSQVSLALERLEKAGKLVRTQGIGRSVRAPGAPGVAAAPSRRRAVGLDHPWEP